MTRPVTDFAVSPKNIGLAQRVGVALFVICVAGASLVAFGNYLVGRNALVEASKATRGTWAVAGRACPSLTSVAFRAARFTLPKAVEIWNVRIEHRFGDADCFMVSPNLWEGDDFPACRFTNPEVIRVIANHSETYYRLGMTPGYAIPATVTLPHGRPRCVEAVRYPQPPAGGPQ